MVQRNLNRLSTVAALLPITKNSALYLATVLTTLIVAFTMIFPQAADAASFVYRKGAPFPSGWQTQVQKASGLKVFWWNIECTAGKANTSNNLISLVNNKKTRPDVIILGEYCKNGVTNAARKALADQGFTHEKWLKVKVNGEWEEAYTPYHLGATKVDGDENGMRVYSRFPIKNAKQRLLPDLNGFLGKSYMQSCTSKKGYKTKWAKAAYWKRPILQFDVVKSKKTYHLAAVHFAQPWAPAMRTCLGSTLKVGTKVLWGVHNPTYAQARTVGNWYKGDKRTLVIGDTNAPKKFKKKIGLFTFTFSSNPYKLMAEKLGPSDVKSTVGTGYAAGMSASIDHAFASSDLKVPFAKVIPFAGSDHTPIYTVVR